MRLPGIDARPLTLTALALVGAILLTASVAGAQTPARVRGVIEKIDDESMTVRARDGQAVVIQLSPNRSVVAVTKASLADIKPGTYVGIAALPQPGDPPFKAQEVVVFPENMRGASEGHYPWDLTPDSTMTNATVETMVTEVNGPLLTLKHKDGQTKISVPSDVPVVALGPGDRTLLKVGAAVFVPAQRAADGSLSAARVLVGKDGVVPPM
jgi:outer membrane lipoprotein SlyB